MSVFIVSLHNLFVPKFFIAAKTSGKSKKFEGKRNNNNVLVQSCQTHHAWVSVEDNVNAAKDTKRFLEIGISKILLVI